jgi:cell division protein FtsL
MSQNINLYDASFRVRRDWLSAKIAAIGLAVVILVVAVAGSVLYREVAQLDQQARAGDGQVKTQQTALQELAKQVAETRPDVRVLAEVAAAQITLEQRRSALQLLNAGGLGDETGYSAALQAFARQSLAGLWLTGVTLNHRDMAIRGRAINPELVPTYLLRLNRESTLQGRSFRALEIQRPLETPRPVASIAPASLPTAPVVLRPASYVEFALASADGIAAPGTAKEGRQ